MHHYTYKITDETGNFYVGSRTSNKPPNLDKYMGSGRWVKSQIKSGAILKKQIIAEFQTRQEACNHEISLIRKYISNNSCKNISLNSSLPNTNWINPFSYILNDGFLSRNKKAVLLWIEVVAMGQDTGISNKFLSIKNGLKVDVCDSLLALMVAELNENLPAISKNGNIWKLNK